MRVLTRKNDHLFNAIGIGVLYGQRIVNFTISLVYCSVLAMADTV